jgi:nucleotide-binding universal stress UspA family protein
MERIVCCVDDTDGARHARILEVLDAEEAALVVIGSRGRGTLRSAVPGSVSSRLGAKAPCPCVIIPPVATGHQLPT